MFKSFTLAVMPFVVLGKGKNDGTDGSNATTTTLMDTAMYKLDLHTYNAALDGISEFHGDLDLQIKTGAVSNQEYGFCFKNTGMWDCMSVMTNLDPAMIDDPNNPEYEQKFMIVDGKSSDGVSISNDEDQDPSQSVNFKNISSKSFKTCELDAATTEQPTDGSKIVTCENVNAHWYRNFITEQQDVSLNVYSVPRVEYKIKGYRRKYTSGDFTKPSGGYIWGEEKMVSLVTENY